MKALVLKRYGGAPQLEFAELARPAIKPDEILVRVHAAGLNPIDNMIPTGSFKPLLKLQLPATMGSDLAGVVVETGSQVSRFKVGDAVFASTFGLGVGTLAEYAAVPERVAALKPEQLDLVQAASIPMVALTAWQALVERAQLQPGQKVLIPAGAGGVGSMAIQLAKLLGAKVATTTSSANVAWVRQLGADEVIDYKRQSFETLLRDYDVVLATLRGGELEKSLQVLGPDSKIISLIGPPDAAFARSRGMNPVMRSVFGMLSWNIRRPARRRKASYSFLFVRPDGQQLATIGAHLAAARLHAVVDTVFPFAQAQDGLAYLAQGRAKGKVVVQLV
ncbi:MAG: NADP-dependent oxidoreductase [Sphingomonadaceae bacterium]